MKGFIFEILRVFGSDKMHYVKSGRLVDNICSQISTDDSCKETIRSSSVVLRIPPRGQNGEQNFGPAPKQIFHIFSTKKKFWDIFKAKKNLIFLSTLPNYSNREITKNVMQSLGTN